MRQVPIKPYLIVGNGRVARHFCFYFTQIGLPFKHWHRDLCGVAIEESVVGCGSILLALSDSSIEAFIENHPNLNHYTLVHFSGAHYSEKAFGAHPLMSFSWEMYDLDVYRKICFVVEKREKTFEEIFPGLANPSYFIPAEFKPFYHSLCVLAGNFSALLWDKLFSDFESRLDLPREIAYPYLEKITENLKRESRSSLTGPLVRADQVTLKRNLQALEGDPYEIVYKAFISAYENSIGVEGKSK